MKRLVVVGDSDIAYWPKKLLPSPSDNNTVDGETEYNEPLVSGHSGATLAGIIPHLKVALANSQNNGFGDGDDKLVVVACAGENDIGEGFSLGKSVKALKDFVETMFLENEYGGDRFLVFLGPKFEPWLENDPSYKKKYEAMARAFRCCLEEYETTATISGNNNSTNNRKSKPSKGSRNNIIRGENRVHFVDCLTMFCGETANVPGARLGGRARADPQFFRSDQLHLSSQGYEIWKKVVETAIGNFLSSSK